MKAEFRHGSEKSCGLEKKRGKESKKQKSKKDEQSEMKRSLSTAEVLKEKKDIAKEYLVVNKRNWGKMSAMMLAAETQDRDIIAHDLCWKIICKVWKKGKIRNARIFLHFNTVSSYAYRSK